MRKKGFTLIELLAVIVVLAIIALIAVPTILGVIDKAKKGALKDSAYGLVDAATLYYAQYGEGARFDFDDAGNVVSNANNKLGYKGKVENGTVIINSKGQITVCVNDNNNAAYKNYLDNNVTVIDSKTCTVPSNTNIVYLDDEATITELDNAALTSKVTELEAQIATLNNTLAEQQTITTTILYDDEITAASTVTLADDYANYDYIEVYGNGGYAKIIPSEENIAFVSQYTSDTNYRTCRVTFNGNQATTGTYYRGTSNTSHMKINRIVGIKIN